VTTPQHVIFGTGAIGLATFEALRRRGETVRLVNRSGHARVPHGTDVVGGDARDPRFTAEVARGARVVYQTLNPPYPEWTAQFPALQAGVLAAAQAAGARLVSMENVYLYGRPAGRPLTETRTNAAHTKKGKLRAEMAAQLLAAHYAGRVEVAIGRASDYFGPRGAQSNLGNRVFPAALKGKTSTVLGDPDQPHTYSYIPDIGEGLAVLGEHADSPGQVWHLPNDPDTRTTRELVELVYRHAGQQGRCKLRRLPPLMLRTLGLFNPTVRELVEMQYQFEEPFIVDASKIAEQLGARATPIDQALGETLTSYRQPSQLDPARPRNTTARPPTTPICTGASDVARPSLQGDST
jgi:nucleoside-diphosphate-sugar epimerase